VVITASTQIEEQ